MFKRLLALIGCVLLLALLLSPARALAIDTQDFRIKSFEADYYLTKNDINTSLMTVKERIDAVFPEIDQNHGILRTIPETYLGNTVSLKIESVTDDNGTPYKFSTYTENGNKVLKIGDANKFVHGETVYKITYSTRNVIDFQASGDELNWDVNGDQWYQHFDSVVARIHIPADLESSLQDKMTCYSGLRGSTGRSCSIDRSRGDNETIITSSAVNLNPNQTLTFELGFAKGTFVLGPEIAAAKRRQVIIAFVILGSLAIPPLIILGYMTNRWRKYGKDPRGKGVIVPQYSPPKGFNALSSGFILDENLSTKAISAAIIELATNHYLLISEIKTKKFLSSDVEYYLKLLRQPSGLSQEQRELVESLFGTSAIPGAEINLKDLRYKLYTQARAIGDILSIKLSSGGYFTADPTRVRSKYNKFGFVFFVLAGLIMLAGVKFYVLLTPLAMGIGIAGIIVILFASAMPEKTAQGVDIKEYLNGLKDYIKLAEADRLKYLQSIKGAERVPNLDSKVEKIKLFEDLLPYAILFGLEKSWAKEFESIYDQPPDWYSGNWTTFNTAYLVSSISSMSTATSAAFSSPSSSGGGGGAGGGGGGGGGGGW